MAGLLVEMLQVFFPIARCSKTKKVRLFLDDAVYWHQGAQVTLQRRQVRTLDGGVRRPRGKGEGADLVPIDLWRYQSMVQIWPCLPKRKMPWSR